MTSTRNRLLFALIPAALLAGCGGIAPAPVPTIETPPPSAEVPFASAAELGELAATALEQQLGGRPIIECPDDVPLVVGNATTCPTILVDNTSTETLITITEFDGTSYEINAVVQ